MSRFSPSICRSGLQGLVLRLFLLLVAPGLAAQPLDEPVAGADGAWQLVISPWTQHYHPSPEHKTVWALGLERETPDHALYGLTLFSNSYGQPSAYGYYGHLFSNVVSGADAMYLKLTVGVIYGYKAPYADKVLWNHHGFAPAIIPALGWRLGRDWSVQASLLGTSAVMFSLSSRL
jgi:hypothetical protein